MPFLVRCATDDWAAAEREGGESAGSGWGGAWVRGGGVRWGSGGGAHGQDLSITRQAQQAAGVVGTSSDPTDTATGTADPSADTEKAEMAAWLPSPQAPG